MRKLRLWEVEAGAWIEPRTFLTLQTSFPAVLTRSFLYPFSSTTMHFLEHMYFQIRWTILSISTLTLVPVSSSLVWKKKLCLKAAPAPGTAPLYPVWFSYCYLVWFHLIFYFNLTSSTSKGPSLKVESIRLYFGTLKFLILYPSEYSW